MGRPDAFFGGFQDDLRCQKSTLPEDSRAYYPQHKMSGFCHLNLLIFPGKKLQSSTWLINMVVDTPIVSIEILLVRESHYNKT